MVKQADAGRPHKVQSYQIRFAWFMDRRPLPIDEGKRTRGEKVISPSGRFTARGPRFFKTGVFYTARGFWLPVTRF